MRIIGIVVLAGGLLALVYGGFMPTRQTHDIVLGNIALSASVRQRPSVPLWAGAALVLAGAALVVTARK